MKTLRRYHNILIEETEFEFSRYLLEELPWDEQLLGIKGLRGVGKTTIMLQYIKSKYGFSEKALYISLDDLYFTQNNIVDLAEDFISQGGEHLFIDEVHKYPNWSIELKKIYDYFKKLKVVFTGSSLLEILNSRSDLSRRALVFQLHGLSFREYLNFNINTDFSPYSLDQILQNHQEICSNIIKQLKPLQHFAQYLKNGYFPFHQKSQKWYLKKLQEVINMTIEVEIPSQRNTSVSMIQGIKKLLYILAMNMPYKPNISSLAGLIGTSRNSILEHINYLNDAEIISSVYKDSVGVGLLKKPDKLYLNNTNFSFSIGTTEPNIGNIRETFFRNQLSQSHKLNIPDKGDFLIDQKFTFEIGGKNKDFTQIAHINNSFIAADNIEIGTSKKIPLWVFGFLY